MTAERVPDPVPPGRTATLPPIPAEYARLEPLYEIQTVLAQMTSIVQACDALLAIVTRVLQARTAVLLDGQELQRVLLWAAAGIAPTVLEEAREHASKTLGYLTGGEIASASVVSRAAVLPGGAAAATVPRHFVTLPLVAHGRVIGVFQLEGAVAFDEADLLFINVVVNQLAVALDRYHVQRALEASRAEVERANRRLRDLQAIAEAALEGATFDESLSAVLRALRSVFATDVAAVLLASTDGKTLRRRMSIGLIDDSEDERSVGSSAAGRIAAGGTARAFDDLDTLEGVSPLRENRIRSLLGAPMHARNRLIGVVYVASRDRRKFADDERQLLELAADRIGTIVENANLYEHALAAIRSRDAVLSIVSHDLRNPLSTVQMSIELLPADDPELTRPVSIIKRSVDVMVRLVSDLRDVASIEAGHLAMTIRAEDSRSLVHDAVEGVQAAAAKKSVRIDVRLPERELVLDCDRIRITQVLTNLLTNAIKFTPAEGSITISLVAADDHARFSVADSGSGIAEAELPPVFDRYWQAKATAHLGTGLGLTIAKGIVEAHGGTISVASRIDHGTTFSFTVPLARRVG